MNFVADENVDQPIVTRLREAGHTVLAIVEMEPSISDEVVLDIANEQEMVLLTGDKDFGELVYRDRRYAFGIVLIRLAGLSAIAKAEVVTSGASHPNGGEKEGAQKGRQTSSKSHQKTAPTIKNSRGRDITPDLDFNC